jgi:hypothetical protein
MSDIATIRAEAAAHPACGSVVYLDHGQCADFEAPYFEAGVTAIAASTLLRSKDYDQEHRDLLTPLRSGTVRLERAEADAPGWYTITAVFPPYGGW